MYVCVLNYLKNNYIVKKKFTYSFVISILGTLNLVNSDPSISFSSIWRIPLNISLHRYLLQLILSVLCSQKHLISFLLLGNIFVGYKVLGRSFYFFFYNVKKCCIIVFLTFLVFSRELVLLRLCFQGMLLAYQPSLCQGISSVIRGVLV